MSDDTRKPTKRTAPHAGGDFPEFEGEPQLWLDADRIKPRRIDWAWRPWLQRGSLSILDADTSTGKTIVALDLAGRFTRHDVMPDGNRCDFTDAVTVVLMVAEDDVDSVVVPRLMAAQADLKRVRIIPYVQKIGPGTYTFLTTADLAKIGPALTGASLLILDPLLDLMEVRADSNKAQDVRRALLPLIETAKEQGLAVWGLRHLNKDEQLRALYRGQGSTAFGYTARINMVAGPERGDDGGTTGWKLLALTKSNNAPECDWKTLRYRPVGVPVKIGRAVDQVPAVEWGGTSDMTADRILRRDDFGDALRGGHALKAAKSFLRMAFKDQYEQPASDVIEQAAQFDISEPTLRRAAIALGVETKKLRGVRHGAWVWCYRSREHEDLDRATGAGDR